MTTPRGEPPHPFVSGVSDGAWYGYQALERVIEGLAESLRLQARTGAPRQVRRPYPRAGQTPPRATPALVDELAYVFAQLLGRAGELAQEVSGSIVHQAESARAEPCIPQLPLEAAAGTRACVQFKVWNTGSTVLRQVTLTPTDLIGAAGRIGSKAVTFAPPIATDIRQNAAASVEVNVAVPPQAVPGLYRGLVQAEPGDTCAVLELTVTASGLGSGRPPSETAAKPQVVVTPVEHPTQVPERPPTDPPVAATPGHEEQPPSYAPPEPPAEPDPGEPPPPEPPRRLP
jgi:hypothetical protein